MNSFDDISSAPDRLMRRIVQSIATNALKTIYPIDLLGESAGAAPYSHIFGAKDDNPLVYYTDIRFGTNINRQTEINYRFERCRPWKNA